MSLHISMRAVKSLILLSCCYFTTANATFSIIAIDPETGEVGSAGATCINNFNLRPVISYIVPGRGAANYQSAGDPSFFPLTSNRILAGDTASEVMGAVNNSDANLSYRQRLIITLHGTEVETAAFDGTVVSTHASSISGANYVMAGNILLGRHVLTTMEDAFNAASGDLTNKLMKSLQSAVAIVGADRRCTNNGTSSASAYLQVAQPTDPLNTASLSLRYDSIVGGVDPITRIYNQYLSRRPDTDGDGVVDLFDQFPADPSESTDSDGDGLGNNLDPDDDNDSVLDLNDTFPLNPNESIDTDGDGVGDYADAFPNDASETTDSDVDGVGDNSDVDANNNGILDKDERVESFSIEQAVVTHSSNYQGLVLPTMAIDGNTSGNWSHGSVTATNRETQPWWQLDLGKIKDITTVKLWNRTDCCMNRLSNFYLLVSDTPFTSTHLNAVLAQLDVQASYHAGTAGIQKAFTINRSGRYIRVQLAGTNILSLAEVQVGTLTDIDTWVNPNDSTDTDGDGVGDNTDAFPNDPNESIDTDGDGIGNNADVFPSDPNESTDSDGDGVGDNADAFPNDPNESIDTDGDGVGNNADAFPNDPNETTDSDGNGVGDNSEVAQPVATHSSNYQGWSLATRAIDGNTSGNWSHGSVTATNRETQPWWQLDLGKIKDITTVKLWNRTDCCMNRLSNFYLLVSDTPFSSTHLGTVLGQPGVQVSYHAGAAGILKAFSINRSGRYIRVQLAGTDILSLAEVQVDTLAEINTGVNPNDSADTDGDGVGDNTDAFPNDPNESIDTDGDGVGNNADAFPNDPNETTDSDGNGVGDNSEVAQPVATHSSNYQGWSLATRAIDGNTSGNWSHGSVTATNRETQPWWQLDLGKIKDITTVKLWNRTDCCMNRLSNFYLLVSDTPFSSTHLDTVLGQPGVQVSYHAGTAGIQKAFSINRSGRYIRVQLAGTDILSLAEVQVTTQ